jgi:hypothetical protein
VSSRSRMSGPIQRARVVKSIIQSALMHARSDP